MDPRAFQASPFGKPARQAGNTSAFWHFQPSVIPRDLDLTPETVLALSDADASLGHLQGLSHLITDPELLIGPYLTREALASSRIEGTQASLSEVLQAEAVGQEAQQSEDVAEVTRYLRASRLAFHLIETLPLTQRLILPVHEALLRGVRGEERNPGEFRRSPVWVGPPGATPEDAVFVPPLPDDLPHLISDWETYVNDERRAPVLVQCGLMHYQFETIHPFLDGNGRIGRLLVSVLLKERGRMTMPLLYLSGYLEAHRDEYYQRLQAVRERGEIQEWVQFFLLAVRQQADDAVWRAGELVHLRETYLTQAVQSRSKLPQLVGALFRNPYITVTSVQGVTGLTNQGARNLIRQAESRGYVHSLGAFGRGGREHWVAEKVLAVLESPMRYGESGS